MKANAELKVKLEKRLSLQKASDRPEIVEPKSPQQEPGTLSRSWKEQISMLEEQREKAHAARKKIEDEGYHHSIALTSEVTKLRVDVEVMRRDLELARKEVQELRMRAERDKFREQRNLEKSVHQDWELAVAEARNELLITDVACSQEERGQLQLQVERLEEEVASHVVSRVRLEAMLRKSEVREAELRRSLDAAEHGRRGTSGSGIVSTFSMHADDDDEDAEADDCADDRDGPEEMDDLEYAYEVTELAGSMSLEHALQLARTSGLWQGLGGRKEKKPVGAGAVGEDASAEGVAVDEYEAPLRELEFALARLRSGGGGGTGSGATGSAGGADGGRSPSPGAAAGTGEAADDPGRFDPHLNILERVLGRLGTDPLLATEDSEGNEASRLLAASRVSAREAADASSTTSLPDAPAQARGAPSQAPTAAPGWPLPAPPAGPSAGVGAGTGEARAEEPVKPMVPAILNFNRMNPYAARLGSKYGNLGL